MLTLPTDIISLMQNHALACYPGECCGLLFAKIGSTTASRCVTLDNMADKLHAMDPVEYPRTSRDWFAPNEAKLGRHVREAQANGEYWLALFHSHIDCGAYFSAEDKRYAAPDGQAVYPEVLQIVIETQAHGIVEAKTFKWDGNDFAVIATHPEFARKRA
jgi:[CysO sulfur-carrier protein]-S-L-cysteine hydrolase